MLFGNTVGVDSPVVIPLCTMFLWYLSEHSADGRAISSPILTQLFECLLTSLGIVSDVISQRKHTHTSSVVRRLPLSTDPAYKVGAWSEIHDRTQCGHASQGQLGLKAS